MRAIAEEIDVGPATRVFVVRVRIDDVASATQPFDYAFAAIGNGETVELVALTADDGQVCPARISAVRKELRGLGYRHVLWHRYDAEGEKLPDFKMTLNPKEIHYG
jgi:hypothetical protein